MPSSRYILVFKVTFSLFLLHTCVWTHMCYSIFVIVRGHMQGVGSHPNLEIELKLTDLAASAFTSWAISRPQPYSPTLFFETVLLCSSGWLGTCCIVQADSKLKGLPSFSTSQVLGFQVCITIPKLFFFFNFFFLLSKLNKCGLQYLAEKNND